MGLLKVLFFGRRSKEVSLMHFRTYKRQFDAHGESKVKSRDFPLLIVII